MKKDLITLVAGVMAITGGSAFAQGAPPPRTTLPTPPASAAPATVPTPPAAADMVATLQKVCLPVLRGGDLKTSASAAGYKQKDGQWVLTTDGDRRIELLPPDEANPHICGATIYARPTSTAALQQALGKWASAQTPPLAPVKVDASVAGAAPPWIDSSWSAQTPGGALGVALGQEQATPANPKPVLESDLQVSLTPA